jgi:2-polyprenyl-6-methoxyphenol hydroxylase-like FAD-dependent oxidoreductase
MNESDVIIAGGGPVGLAIALELAQAGAEVTVCEAQPDRSAVPAGMWGSRSLNRESGTLLHRLGVFDGIRQRALWWFDPQVTSAPIAGTGRPLIEGFVGHFSSIGLKARNLDPLALGDPGFGGGAAAMADIVGALEAAAIEAGASIRMGARVTDFVEDATGVTVTTAVGPMRARWLIASDGGRSSLRKRASIGFPGTDAELIARIAFVNLAADEELEVGDWVETDRGSYIHSPKGRLHIVEYGAPPIDRDAPVSLDEITASFERVAGRRVRVERLLMGQRYTDAARQVETYRKGRLLIAGDAARIHSPAGGQGLNQGLSDAAAIGRLLPPVLRGEAPVASLDAYDSERRPVGEAILAWTRAQSALGRPDTNTRALRRVVADLLDSKSSTNYVLRRLGGDWTALA